jgi:AraC family transcriptional regulator
MNGHSELAHVAAAKANIVRGCAKFRAEGSWGAGKIYGAVKQWSGVDPELQFSRHAHTISLTLNGGSSLTGSRISGAGIYEGRDGPGCVTFVPSGADRRGWYRNVDLKFFVLLLDPDLFALEELRDGRATLQPFTNRRDTFLHTVLAAFANELEQESAVPALFAEHAAGLVMAYLERSVRSTRSGRIRLGRSSQQRFARVFDFIEEHLHLDISTAQLGALLGMGTDVFARQFKAVVGIAPYRYVLQRRLQRAADLLVATEQPLAQIALAVGFSSQAHFTVQFGKYFGVSPGAFRRNS